MLTDPDGNIFLLTSMSPVVGSQPRVLILGSMPGTRSLKLGQYYANPQNRFWRVMQQTAGVSPEAAYPDRLAQLASAGIALWDTLKHCSRVGSLDARIVKKSESPNKVGDFLAAQPTIHRVVFNGQKAAGSFRRLIVPSLPERLLRRVSLATAPSTSAANARMNLDSLASAWKEALGF